MQKRTYVLLLFLFVFCLACSRNQKDSTEKTGIKPKGEMVFEKTKWKMKDGKDYPFRDNMIKDILYNDTIRSLNKDEILDLLGEPSYYRDNKNFLYYRISEERLGFWTLHTKTLVIKLSNDSTIKWIKIHE